MHKYYNQKKKKGVNTCIFSFTDENTDDLERITNFFEDVFEGKNTAVILKKICEDYNIKSLTVDFVYDIIVNKNNPKLAFNNFWEGL